jgi:hypothetical protein
VPLTPAAGERLAREAAQHSAAEAARALSKDWPRTLDGKQVQRWAIKLGQAVLSRRTVELKASQRGQPPEPPLNPAALLVLGPDGGRVQMREKDPHTQSRWKEDKVFTVTSYQPGNGKDAQHQDYQPPCKLVNTHTATMQDVQAFGPVARLEAEKRGLRHAAVVLAIADMGTWIDPMLERDFAGCITQRIADWSHAAEHLNGAAQAAWGRNSTRAKTWYEELKTLLWDGRVAAVVASLEVESRRLGPPALGESRETPRAVLAAAVGYFQRHGKYMDYPRYRANGWPIGSGNTEAGVKQFNQRVKGSERFWSCGLEPILALRALYLCQDERWDRYWATRPAHQAA